MSPVADGDALGASAAVIGDVNGDGFADLLIGGRDGQSWLVLGRPAFAGITDVEDAGIIRFQGENAAFGRAVGAAGDVDGDGLDDLIVGSASNASGLDSSWVIYGDRWLVI